MMMIIIISMSIGFLVDEADPVVWRGLMVIVYHIIYM